MSTSPSPRRIFSELSRATVFADAARVLRVGKTALEPGLNQLAVADLPAGLDLNSVRVHCDRGEVRFVDSRYLPRNAELVGEREAARDVVTLAQKLHALIGQRDALSAELSLIDKVLPGGSELPSLDAPLRPLVFAKGLDVLSHRRKQTQAELRKVHGQISEASEALDEARQIDGQQTQSSREMVVVGVFTEKPGSCELHLSYEAGRASWQPLYSLRLDPITHTVELTVSADVWQKTEEDWDEIAVRLSTSEPEPQLVLPRPRPWILESAKSYKDDAADLYSNAAPVMAKRRMEAPAASAPAPMMASLEAPAELEEVSFGGGGADTTPGYVPGMAVGDRPVPDLDKEVEALPRGRMRPRPEPREEPNVHQLAAGLDFEVDVTAPVSCRSHADRVRVGLGVFSYPAELHYTLRPALKDHAFSKAVVQHTGDTPLLAGPGSVFIEDAFAGAVRVETTPPGGELELQLGPEMRIKCVRNSRTSVHREGLITREDVHRVEVELQIESHLDRPAKLIIEDQVPISTDSKVKVRLLETTPKGARLDDKSGVIRIECTIGPRQRLELGFVYQIEVPRDARIERNLGDKV